MRYLTIIEVAAINQYVIEQFSPTEQIGIKSHSLLDSAINLPKQSAFGTDAYHTVFKKAGALFESIAQNHAFHNGNKRTAFLSDRKSTRLNSSHVAISYAVFCLKKQSVTRCISEGLRYRKGGRIVGCRCNNVI